MDGTAQHGPEGARAMLDSMELASLKVHLAMRHLEQVIERIEFTDDQAGRDFHRQVCEDYEDAAAEAGSAQEELQRLIEKVKRDAGQHDDGGR